jgi:hypothetical protein
VTSIFGLYGITSIDINAAARILQDALNMPFESYESSFWGGYYVTRDEQRGETISLKENFNQAEQEWNWPAFEQYPLTLEVSLRDSTVERSHEIEAQLMQVPNLPITFLQRS